MVSVDGIKLESIQVAASYTEREDPRKTPTILVAYGTEGQQTTRLKIKMNLTNQKKNKFGQIGKITSNDSQIFYF